MVRRLLQFTQDPRAAEVQSVGIHEFIKKAFSRSVKHPIFEAPKETELGLSDTSKQVKFNFNPALFADWESADRRVLFGNDPLNFLESSPPAPRSSMPAQRTARPSALSPSGSSMVPVGIHQEMAALLTEGFDSTSRRTPQESRRSSITETSGESFEIVMCRSLLYRVLWKETREQLLT